jgi:hypothetical protein
MGVVCATLDLLIYVFGVLADIVENSSLCVGVTHLRTS